MANPWISFLASFRKSHPKLKPKALFKAAARAYKAKKNNCTWGTFLQEAVSGPAPRKSSMGLKSASEAAKTAVKKPVTAKKTATPKKQAAPKAKSSPKKK